MSHPYAEMEHITAMQFLIEIADYILQIAQEAIEFQTPWHRCQDPYYCYAEIVLDVSGREFPTVEAAKDWMFFKHVTVSRTF